jgi:hypothetical protein
LKLLVNATDDVGIFEGQAVDDQLIVCFVKAPKFRRRVAKGLNKKRLSGVAPVPVLR